VAAGPVPGRRRGIPPKSRIPDDLLQHRSSFTPPLERPVRGRLPRARVVAALTGTVALRAVSAFVRPRPAPRRPISWQLASESSSRLRGAQDSYQPEAPARDLGQSPSLALSEGAILGFRHGIGVVSGPCQQRDLDPCRARCAPGLRRGGFQTLHTYLFTNSDRTRLLALKWVGKPMNRHFSAGADSSQMTEADTQDRRRRSLDSTPISSDSQTRRSTRSSMRSSRRQRIKKR